MPDGNVVPFVVGLTPAQIAARKDGIGGSDANRIVNGKPEDVWKLILEKRGDQAPDDLSNVLPVQFGNVIEAFNLYWLEKQSGLVTTNRGESRQHPKLHWMRNTLDGMTVLENGDMAVVQAKIYDQYGKLAEAVQQYMPQLQHEMHVCGTKWAVLSVFFGHRKFDWAVIPYDERYVRDLVEMEEEVWSCVQLTSKRWRDMPPPANPELPEIIRRSEPVDMTGNNEWADAAADWLRLKPQAEAFKAVEGRFKGDKKKVAPLIPEAVAKAYAYGVEVTRATNGSLTIRHHAQSANTPAPIPAPADELEY